MPSHLILIAIVLITWRPDETIRSYGAGDTLWQLETLRGTPFEAHATLHFTARYKLGGHGPCNRYRTTMDIPYPWFGTGPIAATKRACPDLAAEAAFFDALKAATLSDVVAGKLILSDDTGALLTFTPAD